MNMSENLSQRSYVRYDTVKPVIPDTEPKDIEDVVKILSQVVHTHFDKHGHCLPPTHAKTQGVVKGKLVVPDDLPKHLKQSLFSKANEYPVVMRYSTLSQDAASDDRYVQPRSAAIKIFNIEGERFPEGEGNQTQDFEFNSGIAEQDLSDARTAVEILSLRMKALADPSTFKEVHEQISARPDAKLQLAREHVRNTHAEALRYYSQVPYRFGDYVCKHRIAPVKTLQKQLFNEIVDRPHALREWLKEYFEDNEAEYLWEFQLLEDENEQNVENSGSPWDEVKYPYQAVARIVFPKQNSMDFKLKAFWEENMSIDSWRGLKSLEPLGGTNRVRRVVYPKTRQLRENFNGREVIDVQNFEDLP